MILMSTATGSLWKEGVPQGCSPMVWAKWKALSDSGRGFVGLQRALGCEGTRGLQYQSLGLAKIPPTLGLPIVCVASRNPTLR